MKKLLRISVHILRGAAVLALVTTARCGADAERPTDVILITIDTLRADHLGLYGYERDTSPQIDHWFESGAVYERAYSPEASTSPSVASILSGRLPQDHRVRLFYQLVPDEVDLLPDLLPAAYQKAAFVSNTVLTDEAMGMGDRFDHYDDFVDARESRRKVFERDARRTTEAALAWLETERDPKRPLFLWVHYIDPHGPYRPPKDWGIPFERGAPRPIPIDRVPGFTREKGLRDGNEYVRRYDAEIAFVDAHIGRLLEGYSRLHAIDDALVVLTADHGESMMEHESWFTHGYHVYEEIVRVPLLVRGPDVTAGRVDVPASGVDVAATVLRCAGAEVPPGLSDADLRRPATLDPGRLVFAEATGGTRGRTFQWRTVVRGKEKWIVAVEGTERRLLEQRYYDLGADPGEFDALSPDGDLAPLVSLIDLVRRDPDPSGMPVEYEKGRQLEAPKVAPGVTEEQLEALRALGYAE